MLDKRGSCEIYVERLGMGESNEREERKEELRLDVLCLG